MQIKTVLLASMAHSAVDEMLGIVRVIFPLLVIIVVPVNVAEEELLSTTSPENAPF